MNGYKKQGPYICCLTGGSVDKEPTRKHRRQKKCRFSPWVGKIPWRRKWQPTPVSLPGKSHGQRSLTGYSPQGCRESDTTECTCTHTCKTQFRSRDTYKLKVRGWKRYSMQMEVKGKFEQHYSYQTKWTLKTVTGDKRRELHNDQEINPRRKYNNCKQIRTQQRSTSLYKAKTNSQKRRNQQ